MPDQKPDETPTERLGSEQARRGDSNPGHTDTKAEGEERDVDTALRNQERSRQE
jgi:hypothetical protein